MKKSHVKAMLLGCVARIEALEKQGCFASKGHKCESELCAEALAFVLGWESGLIEAGVIEFHSPQPYLIAAGGYGQVKLALEVIERREREAIMAEGLVEMAKPAG
jgi:hypothetical protein